MNCKNFGGKVLPFLLTFFLFFANIFMSFSQITFTTNKAVGKTVELKITPKDGENITFDGIKEEYSDDNTTYTLTKSEVKIFGQVENFECLNNGITSLDLSRNIELTDLDCSNNELTELNLSKNTKLSTLYCYQNNLRALDLRANTEIIALYCGDNKLTSIDLSQNQMLISLSLWGNKITNLDLSHNKSISELECYSNEISELTLADDLNITNILLFGNKLSKAAMQKVIDKLPTINISNDEKDSKGFFVAVNKKDSEESNFISERQVKKLTDKGWRVRDYNEGVNDSGEESEFGIPFGGDTDAEENANIIFTTNKAIGETIELKITPKEGEKISIKGVEESYNPDEETATYTLTGSEVRIFGQVESFDCIENGITSLDITKNTELVDLDCSNNELTELDLSKNIKLSTLYCQKNKLKNLNLFRNTELTILFCADNELANIDLVSNRMLNIVSISSNKLTSLDLSRQSELKELYCNANTLTDITLADNSKISSISLFSNKLSKASMQKLIDKLPTISISDNEKYTKGFFVVVNKQNREESNFISKGQVKALTKKGWRVRDYNNGFSDKGEESEFGIAFDGEEDPTEKEDTTSITEVSTSSISVYPNPATSYLIVKGLADNSIARLYNIAGELVLETIVSEATPIDLSKIPSARYILVVDGKAHQILINK